ncbi:MAG: DNA topoisomerase IB [Bauldia sp.]|nr:DNA topoisomerase IB [Bauldia sp.]
MAGIGALAAMKAEASVAYVSPEEPGIRRRRRGKGFSYLDPAGATIADRDILARIRALVIPPAWSAVWICPDPCGHIQATGRDAKGRKQYVYHPSFRAIRETNKFGHLVAFATGLPLLRRQIAADMALRGLPREKVLATVVHLLELTLIRVGNESYAKENGSYGMTTMRDGHVDIAGERLRFVFRGKSGREWNVEVHDRRLARIVRSCQEIPGERLFQYYDATGARQTLSSSDVNAYLRNATGRDVTAKDFRTWAATVLMAQTRRERAGEGPPSKREVKAMIARVAARLGNTLAVCRASYIHPDVLSACEEGRSILTGAARVRDRTTDLDADEAAVLAFLRRAVPEVRRKAA